VFSNDDPLARLDDVELFDHHCHGVVTNDLERDEFEALISESSRPATAGTTRFDSQVGFQIRAKCAPVLDLEPFATPEAYLARRRGLGADEVNSRFLRAANIRTLGIETGHAADTINTADDMARLTGGAAHEIVRLERLAEQVAEAAHDSGTTAAELLEAIEAELDARLEHAVGLDFDAARPAHAEAVGAAGRMLQASAPLRLDDPVMIRHLIWLAIDRASVLQFHIGYGDDDVDLDRCNPLLLTKLLRASADTGARFALLHCYPFHREAGYLADVFPHVYFDVGLAVNYTGARSAAIVAESLELAPFGKILFSSDAFGAAELYYLGTELFRAGLAETLRRFHEVDGWPIDECRRVARMIGYDNAARLYGVDDREAAR
jgi:predicted TIM-barrel fold metal-dependent hydrolase